jgi:ABC-type branched-subunit amino acid transport system substrate-binding protein
MSRSTKLGDTAGSHQHKRLQSSSQVAHRSLLLFLTLLTGCTTGPISFTQPFSQPIPPVESLPPSPVGPKQLRLGMLFSLSGNLARYGKTMQDTTKLLVDTVNGCGGVVNQAVQLWAEDDQSSAVAGKAGMSRLVEEAGVGAVIGAIGSEVSNATIDIAVQNQVVQISPASASPVLTERAKKGSFQGFWFRTMPPDTFQGEALAQLAHQRGFKTVSILTIDNDYGNSIAQSFETTFKKLGGTIAGGPNRYSPFATLYDVDFYTPFADRPEAVLFVAEPNLGSEVLKTAYETGLWSGNTKVLLTSGMKTEQLAGRVGQSIDGRYITSGVLGVAPQTNSPARGQFREIYKKQFNREPGLYDPNTWDAAILVMLAAEAAKATTGTAIKAKIAQVANPPGIEVSDVCQALSLVRDGKEINYQGVSSKVDFTSYGDMIGNYDVWSVDYTGKIKEEDRKIQVGEGATDKSKE